MKLCYYTFVLYSGILLQTNALSNDTDGVEVSPGFSGRNGAVRPTLNNSKNETNNRRHNPIGKPWQQVDSVSNYSNNQNTQQGNGNHRNGKGHAYGRKNKQADRMGVPAQQIGVNPNGGGGGNRRKYYGGGHSNAQNNLDYSNEDSDSDSGNDSGAGGGGRRGGGDFDYDDNDQGMRNVNPGPYAEGRRRTIRSLHQKISEKVSLNSQPGNDDSAGGGGGQGGGNFDNDQDNQNGKKENPGPYAIGRRRTIRSSHLKINEKVGLNSQPDNDDGAGGGGGQGGKNFDNDQENQNGKKENPGPYAIGRRRTIRSSHLKINEKVGLNGQPGNDDGAGGGGGQGGGNFDNDQENQNGKKENPGPYAIGRRRTIRSILINGDVNQGRLDPISTNNKKNLGLQSQKKAPCREVTEFIPRPQQIIDGITSVVGSAAGVAVSVVDAVGSVAGAFTSNAQAASNRVTNPVKEPEKLRQAQKKQKRTKNNKFMSEYK